MSRGSVLIALILLTVVALSGCRQPSDVLLDDLTYTGEPPVTGEDSATPTDPPADTQAPAESPEPVEVPSVPEPADAPAPTTSPPAHAPTAPEPAPAAPSGAATGATGTTGRSGGAGGASAIGGPSGNSRRGPDRGDMFERFDANGDGRLTADELPERAREHMMASDANGDGALTEDELRQAREGMTGGGRRQGRPGGGEGRPRRGFGDPAEMFKRLDTDGDGRVTAAEMPEDMPERFRERIMAADADGDGAVTLEEHEKAREASRGQRGGPRSQGGQGGDR